MRHSNDVGRARRRGGQMACAALVLLAAVGWARHGSAADVAGRVGAGSVTALAIDPQTPTTVYARTECGGAVKSTDGGDSWRAAGSGLPETLSGYNGGPLAIDPDMPSTLYAGKGASNSGRGSAVFKSTNGGDGWEVASTGLPVPNTGCSNGCGRIVIDPLTPRTLYAVGLGFAGTFKSTDGATSWVDTGLTDYSNGFAIDPVAPSTLYAGTGGHGVFKSTDGGATWNAVNAGLPSTDGFISVRALAIDPSAPSTLYAAASGGIFRSTNASATWRAVNTVLADVFVLIIDPITTSTLYAGVYYTDSVFKSTNGGTTWRKATAGLPEPTYLTALAIDPGTPDILYAGTYDGGLPPHGAVFKSTDRGSTWLTTTLAGDPLCGDGVRCGSEACDDGNLVDGDGCDTNCTVSRCGNGIVTPPEECDDGNGDPSDGCTNACTICGNGVLTAGEECDDGNRNNNDGCTNACRPNVCGDGFRNPAAEQCDDGNGVPFDGCTNTCTICGNGIITTPEQCDDANRDNQDGCTNACLRNACGDGFVNPATEQCDDGNTVNGDGCDANCTPTACGNGVVSRGEGCDDGNTVNGDGCDSNCTPTACGNGVVTAGEECDDGNLNPFDGCTAHCTLCGNGVATPPEQCDDGNTNPFDGCTTACTMCGNGIVTPPEACDDGNHADGDGCTANCVVPNVCGNALPEADEECDDGGLCVGGATAGTFCTTGAQCKGGACTTFGGDGCAANCTAETAHRLVLDPQTSQIVFHPGEFRVAGSLTLRFGHPRKSAGSDAVPVAVRAADVSFAPLSAPGFRCLCIRGTENSAREEGVSGTGSMSCTGGLAGVNVRTSIDHNTNTHLLGAVLAVDPVTPGTLYAGMNGGGVFKSTDSGVTWDESNGGLTYTGVLGLAIDPLMPSTLYASMSGNQGVFKSTDAGGSWSPTGLTDGGLVALAIDPGTPGTLYAGVGYYGDGYYGGVLKSTDAGATWGGTDPIGATVFALAIDPSVPSTLYAGAGTGTDNGNGGGVFKSTDAGATWGATGLTNTFVGALAIDPITPETLYAGTGYYQHDGGGVFRSTDAGATWSATGLTNIFGLGALGIDPRMPSTLFASPGGGVFTSTDSGATWNAVNTGLPEDPAGNTYVSALVIDPITPRTLYAATYSGVFKSTNGGGTWTGANEGVDPTCAAGFLEDGSMDHPHLGICNGPEEVRFSGMGSAGSARLDLRLESWSIEPTQSDGGACTVDPANPANGLDGMPCTDDDPGRAAGTGAEANATGEGGGAWVGPYHPQTVPLPHEFTLRLTTARAAAEIQDFGNERGRIVSGEVEGTPLRCEALDQVFLDTKLAGAIVALDTDVVATFALSSGVPVCAGDCDGSGSVTVDELIIGVNIALGSTPIDHCASFDTSSDGQVAVDELIAAVGAALNACGQ